MDSTGIVFNNDVIDGKLENGFTYRNFYNGGGVGIGDINNDGLPDVFLSSNMGESKLYLNKGNWKFEDISKTAGLHQDSMWNTGVVFVDINNDGWLDMYVCSAGHMKDANRKNKLYINNHHLGFSDSAANYGLDISAYTTQASFFDYDLDGDLDCFMINNSPIPINTLGYSNRRDLADKDWPVANFLKGGGDHLFRNDNGHFTEVTKDAGIHGTLISFGLGVSIGDLNGDGYPDVFVSNDSYERDYIYINQKNGSFKDEAEQWMEHFSFSSMGADIADINNDGYPEIFTTDMLPEDDYRLKTLGSFDNIDLYKAKEQGGFYHQFMKNCLMLNNRNGKFIDIANYSGVSATDWSWGALMFDADNDGLNDIYVCNGVNRDVTNLDFVDFFASDAVQKLVLTAEQHNVDKVLEAIPRTPMINKAYRNLGNLKFSDDGIAWGFTQPSFSNGAAYGDLDNDGDLDLIINNENQPAFLYKNNARELNKNNYIALELKGDAKNKYAIGAKIKLYAGKEVFTREQVPCRGFQSSVDYKLLIGLGKISQLDSMVIIWPDLSESLYLQPAINKTFTATIGENKRPFAKINTIAQQPMLAEVKNIFEKHKEDDFIDFYYERNIPAFLSREGPRAACGDVNGDGLEDIYIGGTTGQGGALYLQDAGGGFAKKEVPVFKRYSDFEDIACLLFDCDKDGDLDLLVCAGGNSTHFTGRQLQHRLYINDGKGNFDIDTKAFPSNDANIAVAIANDFDNDGDLDLFIGGRNVPQSYGATPASYLYVNDGKGHFTDIAKTKNPEIAGIGMVTGAAWADITGDAQKELVIVGEWMTPRVFTYRKDHFEEVKTNLSDMYGWWQTVNATDINGDGKVDLVLGNIGQNFYLNPGKEQPVKLFIADFNNNGTYDKILTRTIDGKDKPVFLKRDMQDQIPSIKKQNLKHAAYATKSIQELFSAELLAKATVKQFNYTSSCIAINNGNGTFTIQQLPPMVQMSSVNAAACQDVNGDGYKDLVLAGNLLHFQPQLERLDGSYGHVLLNDGKGNLTWVEPSRSGLQLGGMVKDIQVIQTKKSPSLLFLRNDDYPALYQVNAGNTANSKH